MIDWNKPIQTGDGAPAQLLLSCGSGIGVMKIIRTGEDAKYAVFEDGRLYPAPDRESSCDIINVPAATTQIKHCPLCGQGRDTF